MYRAPASRGLVYANLDDLLLPGGQVLEVHHERKDLLGGRATTIERSTRISAACRETP